MDEMHDNAYAGLLVNDQHWAFGTLPENGHGEDPLAGVDTSVPEGIDGADLAAYCLMLGDDALVLSHRLSEWCSRAPDLEEDIALANIALDLLGQARLLLARAAAADPTLVPARPDGSPVPAEDALAFFRDDQQFRNARMAEVPNGDFAETVTRILVFSAWRLALLKRLRDHRDAVLAAVAAKGVKELAYHRDFAGRWFLTLALGTEESRARLVAAVTQVWPLVAELFETHEVEARVGVDPASVRDEVEAILGQVFATSGLELPDVLPPAGVPLAGGPQAGGHGRKGRDGLHTEALSRMLAEMQVVARAHPSGRW